MVQIFAFGHSITYGNWDTEGGWVQRLREFLDERALEKQDEELVSEVLNLGIPGETSEELLERFEDELERRLWEEEEQVIIFQTGTNDSQVLVESGETMVDRKSFRDNLEQLIEKAEEYTENIIVVGEIYTTIEGTIPWAEDKSLSDERLGRYVDTEKEVCREKDVDFINLRSLKDRKEWTDILEEGLHPNDEGHNFIYNEVKENMREKELI